MNIKVYKRGEKVQLTKNFSLSEMECKCGKCPETPVDLDHMAKLQKLRDDLGKTITITSGYRCLAHNAAIGGEKNSWHTKGTATDIKVTGMDPNDVQDKCEHFDGMGRYDTFTHVDSRGTKARWDFRSAQKKKSSSKPAGTTSPGDKVSPGKTQHLPDGPSKAEINITLEDIEKEVFKK